jgi:methionine-rich copper-binding protein CopC
MNPGTSGPELTTGAFMRTFWRYLLATATVLFIAMMVPRAAWAHVELSSSDPADKAVVTEQIGQVTLRFSGPVKSAYVLVTVTGPAGATIHTGTPSVLDGVVTQRITQLQPGMHTVAYQVVAADGDPVTGAITFTVDLPTPVGASPTAAAASEAGGSPVWGWWVAAGAAVIAIGVLAAQRRKPTG